MSSQYVQWSLWSLAIRACLAVCLHVSSSRHNCSFLFRWSLITTLDGALPWSPYLQFACSVELCGSLLWSPIQCPSLPTPHRKWFMWGIRSGKFLHWSSFIVMVLIGGRLQGWVLLTGLLWKLAAVPGIFFRSPRTFDGTTSQAHQLALNLNRVKCNLT